MSQVVVHQDPEFAVIQFAVPAELWSPNFLHSSHAQDIRTYRQDPAAFPPMESLPFTLRLPVVHQFIPSVSIRDYARLILRFEVPRQPELTYHDYEFFVLPDWGGISLPQSAGWSPLWNPYHHRIPVRIKLADNVYATLYHRQAPDTDPWSVAPAVTQVTP